MARLFKPPGDFFMFGGPSEWPGITLATQKVDSSSRQRAPAEAAPTEPLTAKETVGIPLVGLELRVIHRLLVGIPSDCFPHLRKPELVRTRGSTVRPPATATEILTTVTTTPNNVVW
ncbi:MAG: hypothetical protein EPN47_13845 [Acidobacteria bacterium]|nr:MAG: hypothetical protein EPN47_13845 [Acidobacteriota bacterium]